MAPVASVTMNLAWVEPSQSPGAGWRRPGSIGPRGAWSVLSKSHPRASVLERALWFYLLGVRTWLLVKCLLLGAHLDLEKVQGEG